MFADLDKKQANGWKCDEHTEVVKKKIVKVRLFFSFEVFNSESCLYLSYSCKNNSLM